MNKLFIALIALISLSTQASMVEHQTQTSETVVEMADTVVAQLGLNAEIVNAVVRVAKGESQFGLYDIDPVNGGTGLYHITPQLEAKAWDILSVEFRKRMVVKYHAGSVDMYQTAIVAILLDQMQKAYPENDPVDLWVANYSTGYFRR